MLVCLAVFKTVLQGVERLPGGFDSHVLPPVVINMATKAGPAVQIVTGPVAEGI